MMNDMRTLLLTAAFLTPFVSAQEAGSQPPQVRVTPDGVQKWIRQLGSDSYRDRLDAENKLRAKGKAAKSALEAAAGDERDPEVQWRAKRLLRQLAKPEAGGESDSTERGLVDRNRPRDSGQDREIVRGGRRESGGQGRARRDLRGIGDVQAEFDRIFRELERDHGVDVPRFRFFDDRFFDDIRAQMERMQVGGRPGGGGTSQSQGMSVQMGPDGVRVEVTETDENGDSDTKVYTAPDMETFHKKHPGVLKKGGANIGLRGLGLTDPDNLLDGLRMQMGKPERGFGWQLLKPQVVPLDRAFRPAPVGQPKLDNPAVPAKGKRLGVQIKPIPTTLRDYLELAPGTGLMVDVVQQDTLAAALRLQPGDIVVAINGAKIDGVPAVQKALGSIKAGSDVKVEFIRRGERREATAKKQHDAARAREEIAPKPRKRIR